MMKQSLEKQLSVEADIVLRACWKSQKTKEMWVREVWTEKA